MKFDWACPKCDADANEHGKGMCLNFNSDDCSGFICDCSDDTGQDHGTSFAKPCPEANCYHCGWGGTFPVKPKGLQAWEKKALEAGWSMPLTRKLKLKL